MPTGGEISAGPTLQLITYDDGIDTDDEWSQFWEGEDYDVDISLIQLSTVKDGEGPPLHFHPYPETIMVRRGRSTVTVGARELEGNAGQTIGIPATLPTRSAPTGPSAMRASRSTPIQHSCRRTSARREPSSWPAISQMTTRTEARA